MAHEPAFSDSLARGAFPLTGITPYECDLLLHGWRFRRCGLIGICGDVAVRSYARCCGGRAFAVVITEASSWGRKHVAVFAALAGTWNHRAPFGGSKARGVDSSVERGPCLYTVRRHAQRRLVHVQRLHPPQNNGNVPGDCSSRMLQEVGAALRRIPSISVTANQHNGRSGSRFCSLLSVHVTYLCEADAI